MKLWWFGDIFEKDHGLGERAQQPELEKQLNINDSPNVIVVNPRKHVSVKMLQGFHKSGIEEFFRNIAYGKTGTAVSTFDEFAEVVSVDAWDGKDGKLEVEDDDDLGDFEWDDDEEDGEYDQWGRKIDEL
jgi:protein disulfide-isomerase A6